MSRVYIDDLVQDLKAKSYQNAVRLFRDACTLYASGGYPTAFAIAVLAYEELGKVLDIAHLGECTYTITLDDPSGAADFFNGVLDHGGLRNHRHKQVCAFLETNILARPDDPKLRFIAEGGLEIAKQQALYVELTEDDEVLTQSRITQAKAFAMLEDVLSAFKASRDVSFGTFDGDSHPKAEWLATEQLRIATEAFDRCLAHNTERGPLRLRMAGGRSAR